MVSSEMKSKKTLIKFHERNITIKIAGNENE